jgi:hypothetical protein
MRNFLFMLGAAILPLAVLAASPAEIAASYAKAAGAPASAERGRTFFTTTHGSEWSCATCHHERPTTAGRHARTGKTIEALAPAGNPTRLTDPAWVEKWLRRNCNDVAGRECSAQEKADVTFWLSTLKP